ncbi:MAG: oxidoreductase [Pirellulaceae bacterium]|nr:MAG: oxidoreductase [Pirellulaceae bacterium]
MTQYSGSADAVRAGLPRRCDSHTERCVRSMGPVFVLALALSLVGETRLAKPVHGQVPGPAASEIPNRFLPPPRALLQHLARGREAIRQGQWNVAVDELGAVLAPDRHVEAEADIDQDYFLQDSDQGTASSLRQEAQRLVGSLPPAGRQLYELRFGAAARALLLEAVQQHDISKLTEVIRRYLHTQAGYQAMLLLARHYLEEGKPSAALLCLQRLLEIPEAQRLLEPELSLLAAYCQALLGETAQAARRLADLRNRFAGQPIVWGAESVPAFSSAEQAQAWLADKLPMAAGAARLPSWLVYRGSASRNAPSQGGMLVRSPRWWVPVANDPQDEQLIAEQRRQMAGGDAAQLPALQPLAVDEVVLMRTTNRLMAVDLVTGKRIWEFPWDETPEEESGGYVGSGSASGTPRASELAERLWKDAPYGQLASDGQRVFALHDLSYALWVGNPTVVAPGGLAMQNPKWPRKENKLVALDLARQGALLWIVGGPDGGDEPALANAFFLGPPLPAMGQLFVLAEVLGELRLMVLEPATGKLLWQQQLGHVDNFTIDQDPQRRLAGACPSYADGVLVCPTSAGAVVAIDIATRSLLWGFRYPTNTLPQPFARMAVPRIGNAANLPDETWADATVTIAEGRVVLTPVESDELYCLNLLDGTLAWPPRKRDTSLYVACIHQGKIILVGKHSVQAIALADGSAAWSAPLQLPDEAVGGRGFFSGRWYFLPTSVGRVHKIDLESGTIVESVQVRGPLGNLICHRDQVLALGPDGLAAYYQLEALERWVQARLAEDPMDREALARKCDLLLQRGQRRQALEIMWTIHEQDPNDEAARRQLVDTYLDALDEDFASYASMRERIEPLIDEPAQRAELLRKLVVGLESLGRWDEAFQSLLKLADLWAAQSAEAEPLETVGPQWSVRPRRWIQGRMAALLEAVAGAEHQALRDRWQEQLQRRLEQILRSGSRSALRLFIEQFAPHPVAQQARRHFARMLYENGEFLAAELQLVAILGDQLDRADVDTLALAAELYLRMQRLEGASHCLQVLEQLDPDARLSSGQTVAAFLESLRKLPAYERLEKQSAPWPYGLVRSRVEQPSGLPFISSLFYPARIEEAYGLWPRLASVTLDLRSNQVVVRDGWGQPLQQALLNQTGPQFGAMYGLARAKAVGHLLLMAVQSDVVAIDALRPVQDPQDAVLWRVDLAESTPNIAQRRLNQRPLRHPWNQTGVRVVLADFSQQRIPLSSLGPVAASGVCYQRYRQLTCVDPLSGEVLWTRDGMEHGAQLFGDDQYLFVVGYDQTEALVLRTATGEILGRRPSERIENRWATLGRRVLAWHDEAGQLALRIYDAWSGEEFWRELFPIGSRAELVDDEKVAVFRPDGEFLVASLREGKVVLRTRLDPVPAASHLIVQADQDAYYVFPGSIVPPNARTSLVAPVGTGSAASPILQGKLYALDAVTGRPLWPIPVQLDGFSVPSQQPPLAPILTFVRGVRSGNSTSLSVVCVDKRDGRAVYENYQLPLLQASLLLFEIAADPVAKNVRLQAGGQQVYLEFTGEPIPPAAPWQGTQGGASND